MSDLEIARAAKLAPIEEIGARIGLDTARLAAIAPDVSVPELEAHLREHERDLAEVPLVFLWLHRTPEFLRTVKDEEVPVTELEGLLNGGRRPSFEAGPADAGSVAAATAELKGVVALAFH